MTDERRMTTDRFFGGIDGRLENSQLMLSHVDERKPTQTELWTWLKRQTNAGSEPTIEKYVQFIRAISLLKRRDGHYITTIHGEEYAKSGDSKLIFDLLTDHVKGFETILQAIANGDRTVEQIQAQL